MRRRNNAGAARLGLACVALVVSAACSPYEPPIPERAVPQPSETYGYVSSRTCEACHPANYQSWHTSYHRTMTQVASRDTVLAPWEPAVIEGRGRRLELDVRDGVLWADDVDPAALLAWSRKRPFDAPPDTIRRRSGPVVMTTGSHHMQIYWFRGEEGLFHQLNWVWFERHGRWVPVEDVYSQPPHGTTGPDPGKWNTSCIRCHSTGPEPRLERSGGRVSADTRVGELGIACEACHGPAQAHIEKHRSPVERYTHHLTEGDDASIVNPAKLDHARESEICGQCHHVGRPLHYSNQDGTGFRPGDVLAQHIRVGSADQLPDDATRAMYYWPDGTSRVTGREYNAFTESLCFTAGEIRCSSCHALHQRADDPRPGKEWANDQLAPNREGNAACSDCHSAQATALEEHTHHPVSSEGANCLNCHMPHTVYGLLSVTRSHTIDSPAVRGVDGGARPNACNLCHLDRSLGWTQQALGEWYGRDPIALTEEEQTPPASVLWLARGDSVQRATAAWHMGWEPALAASGDGWQAPWLARSLEDPYASVRYLAGESLRRLPGFEDFAYDYVPMGPEQRAAVERALARSGPGDADLFRALRAARHDPDITLLE